MKTDSSEIFKENRFIGNFQRTVILNVSSFLAALLVAANGILDLFYESTIWVFINRPLYTWRIKLGKLKKYIQIHFTLAE